MFIDVKILYSGSILRAFLCLFVIKVKELHFSQQETFLALEGFPLLGHRVDHLDLYQVV